MGIVAAEQLRQRAGEWRTLIGLVTMDMTMIDVTDAVRDRRRGDGDRQRRWRAARCARRVAAFGDISPYESSWTSLCGRLLHAVGAGE